MSGRPSWVAGVRVDTDVSDAVKAILIVAITIGHARALTETIPGMFRGLYFWHVHGFFLLAFISRGFQGADMRITDMLVRYMTPFMVFVLCLGLPWLVRTPTVEQFGYYVAAAFIGTAELCERSTQMSIFWFLPALAGMIATMITMARLIRAGWLSHTGLAMLAVVMFIAAPLIPPAILNWVPLSVGLTLYLLPLSMLLAVILDAFMKPGRHFIRGLFILIALGLVTLEAITTITMGNGANISLFAYTPPPTTVSFYVLNAGAAVAANLLVWWVAPLLARSAAVRAIGRRSLHIFLFQQFILYPVNILLLRDADAIGTTGLVALGMLSVLLAILVTFGISLALDRLPRLRTLVFPKDWPALRTAIRRPRDFQSQPAPR